CAVCDLLLYSCANLGQYGCPKLNPFTLQGSLMPTRRVKLDRIDRRILDDLQQNGRMTNVDLARRAGISAPPCLRRVRALEEAVFIRGYHADIAPELLGYELTVFALIGLFSQAKADLRIFEDTVNGWAEVRECHML